MGLIANSVLYLEEDRFGAGKHLWDVKGNDFSEYMKVSRRWLSGWQNSCWWRNAIQLVNGSQIIYSPVILIVKLSIMLLLLRVFAPVRATYIVFQIVLWAHVLFYAAGTIVEIFQCQPREKIWYPLIPGTCINEIAAQLAAAIFNTVSDFAILVVPIASVWKLQLPAKKKAGLVVIFGTGLLFVQKPRNLKCFRN